MRDDMIARNCWWCLLQKDLDSSWGGIPCNYQIFNSCSCHALHLFQALTSFRQGTLNVIIWIITNMHIYKIDRIYYYTVFQSWSESSSDSTGLIVVCGLLQLRPPSHLQCSVQPKGAAWQPQACEKHGLSDEQEQHNTFITSSGATFSDEGNVEGSNTLNSSFLSHPYFVGSTFGGSSVALIHIAAWRWALFTFSLNAAVVGGSEHRDGTFLAVFFSLPSCSKAWSLPQS